MRITIDFSGVARAAAAITSEHVQEIQQLRDKVALDIFGELVMTTPVDTGHARNGWQIDNPPGGNIEITNNVEYVEKLDQGHSQQAPAGFIQAAIDRHTR